MGLRMIFFFKHFPKIFALSYVFVGISFWLVSSQLFPYWWFWLLLLGVLYGIKDYYLEGYAILEKSELENYPSWVRNHVMYGLDGYIKVKRRILMESL